MKRPAIFLFLGALLLPLSLFAAGADQSMTSQILTATPNRTEVAMEFDGGALLSRVNVLEFGESMADGYGTLLAVAGQGTPTARVIAYELGEPLSGTLALSADDAAETADELVMLSEPAVLHDLRIVALNFRPVLRTSGGTLHAVTRIQAEVSTVGAGGVNTIAEPQSFSSAFYPIYRAAVANLDDLYPEISVREPGRYLVIAATRRLNVDLAPSQQFQRWLELKQRKGYHMQVVTLQDVRAAAGDSSVGGIARYIRDAYNNTTLPRLEYCMLIGLNTELPSHSRANPEFSNQYSIGDNAYFAVAGGDSLPDILGGRVSGRSAAQLVTYFNKVYQYETAPHTADMNWFRSVNCTAGNFADGSETFPVTPVWNLNWSRTRLLRDGCITDADTFYFHGVGDTLPPGGYRTFIRRDIDDGVCMVLYRGWGNSQGWAYPVFYQDDVRALNNGTRMPAVFSIVCGTGDFSVTSPDGCFGETWTTGTGTPSQPQGGIIFFGASDLHTNTRHNNAILSGIITAQLEAGVRGAAALGMAGKLEGWRQFPRERGDQYSANNYAWFYVLHVFNLLGDPETQIYACSPQALELGAPGEVGIGETLLPVIVTAGGQPVYNAVVTLRAAGSDDVATARTDGQGRAWLDANFSAAGTAELTAWASRHFMAMQDITVASREFDPKIEAVNWTAGADNLPNPGENATFTLTVRNAGTNAMTPSITVTSLDERVTVTSGSATIATIEPGATQTSSPIAIQLSGNLYDGETPLLAVQFQGTGDPVTRLLEVPVAAPDPMVIALTVQDGGNGILEANEEANISVTIRNVGGQAAANLTAVVHSHDNAITFPDDDATWTAVGIGETAASTTTFRARLQDGATPGRQIVLRFVFEQGGTVMARKDFTLHTGVVTATAPTGPDAYGYYAYENIDAGYAATPAYDWIELDPAYGGAGADTHTVRDDTHFGMALPRPFTYYGQAFDSVWICSNGWFSFEYFAMPEFRNFEIPSPIGPPSMVCPFWDDLIIDRTGQNDDSAHTVWTRYDAPQERFIIQWRAFNRRGLVGDSNVAYCVFEAILEYPPSDDGSIVFQYNRISNVDTKDNYGSVGIQDSYHQRGLGLTYANFYPPSVDTLRAGRAIRFTTQAPDAYLGAEDTRPETVPARFALHNAYPNPFNPSTVLQFDLPRAAHAELRIYDVLGREVTTLLNDYRMAGSYHVTFTADGLPTGLYFAKLTAGSDVQVRKLMLLK